MLYYFGKQKFTSRDEVLTALAQATRVAIDTEVAEDGRLIGVAMAWTPEDAVFFPRDSEEMPLEFLSRVPVVFHNALYDIAVLRDNYNILVNCIGDTMLLAQSCGYPPALGDLSFDFNFNHSHITSLIRGATGKKIAKKKLGDAPIEDVAKLCSQHAEGTIKIWDALRESAPMAYHLDFSLIPVIQAMHDRGIRVDPQNANRRYAVIKDEMDGIKDVCKDMGFNPGSTKQVGIALSNAGIITGFTRKGHMETGEEALSPFQEMTPIVPLVLAYRERQKTASTYLKPLLEVERVYPHYHIVRTGRFASHPNIQNIPEGIRDLYLPEVGEWFWDADASQIEPRLMAWFSGDQKMWRDVSTGDVYQPIATRMRISRYTAKQLVLAASYEAGADMLVSAAHRRGDTINNGDAQNLIDLFYKEYPRFKAWKQEVRQDAERDGYVYTLLGRKRTLQDMVYDEYIGYDPLKKTVNTLIQGSAADLLKLAMWELRGEKLSATIHDEILISTDHDIDIAPLLSLGGIPLAWTVSKGENWKEVKQ